MKSNKLSPNALAPKAPKQSLKSSHGQDKQCPPTTSQPIKQRQQLNGVTV